MILYTYKNMKYEDILKNILVRCFSIKKEHKTNIFMYRFFSSVNKWTKTKMNKSYIPTGKLAKYPGAWRTRAAILS